MTTDDLAGELARAGDTFELALTTVRVLGDPIGEAFVLQSVGVAKVRQGEFGQARSALLRAMQLAGTAGERLAEARALLGLSELALTSGDPREDVVFGRQASDAFREMGTPLLEAGALTLLSEAHTALGDSAAADVASAQAAVLRAKPVQQVASGGRHPRLAGP